MEHKARAETSRSASRQESVQRRTVASPRQGNTRGRSAPLCVRQRGMASRGALLTAGGAVLAVLVIAGVYVARDHSVARGSATEAAAEEQLSQADRDKLSAVENAFKSGVLTKDEYEAKKRQIYAAAAQRGGKAGGQGVMAAAGPLPNYKPPEGYQAFDQPGGGRILAGTFSGNARSASAVLGGINGAHLRSYFDAAPQINSAVRDPNDQNVLAAFDASLGGKPVRGLTVIGLVGGGGGIAVLFDHVGRIDRTLPEMLHQLRGLRLGGGGSSGGMNAANVPLRQTPCPDGKCSIGLPPGWQISGYGNAAVDVMGSNGEALDLGIYMPIFTNPMPGSGPVFVSPYIPDPVRATMMLTDEASRMGMAKGQPPVENLQILEAQPAPPPSGAGQAAYIFSRFEMGGRRYLSYGISNSIPPVDYGSWAVYYSTVRAPEEVFRQEFSLLLRVWGTWQIPGKVLQERMEAAAESMRQTHEILRSTAQNTSDAFERANKGWDYYIRDVEIVKYEPTGEHSKPLDRDFADWLHKQDPRKFTILDASQYNKTD